MCGDSEENLLYESNKLIGNSRIPAKQALRVDICGSKTVGNDLKVKSCLG